MNQPTVEVFISTKVKIPHPRLIQVLFCQHGDTEATTLYVGHDLNKAMEIFQNQPVGEMAICSLYLNKEVYMRNDNIKQDFPQDVYPELPTASKKRFNQLVMIHFKERFDVQIKMYQKVYEHYRPYRSLAEKASGFFKKFKKQPSL